MKIKILIFLLLASFFKTNAQYNDYDEDEYEEVYLEPINDKSVQPRSSAMIRPILGFLLFIVLLHEKHITINIKILIFDKFINVSST